MKIRTICLIMALLGISLIASAQKPQDPNSAIDVVILKDPYSDSRTGPELLQGPEKLANGGLFLRLGKMGCSLVKVHDIKMPQESEREYGEWNRASLTNRVLGKIISSYNKDDVFFLGLLSGSKSVVGMLAGLQHMGPDRRPLKDSLGRDILGLPRLENSRPLKVGLVWIASQAAFNTPDTTIEGDMGGMNVAVAAGLSHTNLRMQAGLDPPISTKFIVLAGVRDTTPYEEYNIDNSFIERISVQDLCDTSDTITKQLERLSRLTDVIYTHVDLGVLDPVEIPGYPDPCPGGPTSAQLAETLKIIFSFPQAAALGIASCPDEPETITLEAAYRIVEGAIKGVKVR